MSKTQLPWYEIILDCIEFLTASYLTEGGVVYDIGSGTGNLYQKIRDVLEQKQAEYIGIEKVF